MASARFTTPKKIPQLILQLHIWQQQQENLQGLKAFFAFGKQASVLLQLS